MTHFIPYDAVYVTRYRDSHGEVAYGTKRALCGRLVDTRSDSGREVPTCPECAAAQRESERLLAMEYEAHDIRENTNDMSDLPPEVIASPVPCNTPACMGPATIWRIGRLTLKICQNCAGHWGMGTAAEKYGEEIRKRTD